MQIKIPNRKIHKGMIVGAAAAIGVFFAVSTGRILWPAMATEVAQNQIPNVSGNCNIFGNGNNNNNLNCTTTPPRRSNGLYQTDQMVGIIGGLQLGPGANQITLQNLRIGSNAVDLRSPLELQNAIIQCPDLAKMMQGAAMTVISISGPTTCEILGKRQ
jgi:hypothetical protein